MGYNGHNIKKWGSPEKCPQTGDFLFISAKLEKCRYSQLITTRVIFGFSQGISAKSTMVPHYNILYAL